MNTEQWIEHARRGDEATWKDIIAQHQEGIFRLAYLILGDYDDAMDVAQETFIRAYLKFWQFDANKTLRPWLYRIASNLAYNLHRSRLRRSSVNSRYKQGFIGNAQHPEDLSIEEVEARDLRNAVTKLKHKDQEIIYFRYFMGFSVNETSESLGVSPGTVKSRIHRALKRLSGVIRRDYPTLERGSNDE